LLVQLPQLIGEPAIAVGIAEITVQVIAALDKMIP
jgi:hypothetical protein